MQPRTLKDASAVTLRRSIFLQPPPGPQAARTACGAWLGRPSRPGWPHLPDEARSRSGRARRSRSGAIAGGLDHRRRAACASSRPLLAGFWPEIAGPNAGTVPYQRQKRAMVRPLNERNGEHSARRSFTSMSKRSNATAEWYAHGFACLADYRKAQKAELIAIAPRAIPQRKIKYSALEQRILDVPRSGDSMSTLELGNGL
jgi:hypothetical protein